MSTTEPGRRRGVFITFEGLDGSGKTTQMRLLARRLRAAGYSVVETVEPGGTAIGDQIRRILLDAGNRDILPVTELLLYFAARAQNVGERIRPALERGAVVLSDRYTDSTVAYQGIGRGLGEPVVAELHRIACGGLDPDLTIHLDVDPAAGRRRVVNRNRALAGPAAAETRMDEQSAAFYRKVRAAYQASAARHPQRFRTIDANREIGAVAEAVWKVAGKWVRDALD